MINIGGHDPELAQRVRAAHRVSSVVVLAFAATVVFYVALAYIIRMTGNPKTESTQVPVPFYAGAVFLALGSIVFRRTQMHRFRLEAVALKRGLDGLIKHFFNVTMVSAALAEMIGLLGLASIFFGGEPSDALRMGVVALAITLYNYPRRAAWQETVDYFSATLPK